MMLIRLRLPQTDILITFCSIVIIFSAMILDPFEREAEQTNNTSKNKVFSKTIIPVSLKILQSFIKRKEDLSKLGKTVVIARVVQVKQMVGRRQIKITDDTGVITIVDSNINQGIQENSYYRFVFTIRLQKQEPVFYSLRNDIVKDFNQIQYHWSTVMFAVYSHPFLQI